jgi:hypothetical protein
MREELELSTKEPSKKSKRKKKNLLKVSKVSKSKEPEEEKSSLDRQPKAAVVTAARARVYVFAGQQAMAGLMRSTSQY